jgi:peptidoglycan/LPS O-acetylase OafA/YrhL
VVLVNAALSERFRGGYFLPVGYSTEGVTIAFLLFWAMRHTEGNVGRALTYRPVRWLGRLSYSLYIWQQFFFSIGRFAFPFNVLAAVAVASGSYYFLERPLLKVRDRVLSRA